MTAPKIIRKEEMPAKADVYPKKLSAAEVRDHRMAFYKQKEASPLPAVAPETQVNNVLDIRFITHV